MLGVQGHLHAEARCLAKQLGPGGAQERAVPTLPGVGTSSKGIHVPLPAQLGLGTWCGVLVGWDQVLQGKSWGWGWGCLCMALQASPACGS